MDRAVELFHLVMHTSFVLLAEFLLVVVLLRWAIMATFAIPNTVLVVTHTWKRFIQWCWGQNWKDKNTNRTEMEGAGE